jgi:enolase
MSDLIAALDALEILDSRGNPTLRVFVQLEGGIRVSASVPSGASTGANEAVELRDGDERRYGGKGVRRAVENVTEVIAPKLVGCVATSQREIDNLLIEMDGTKDKSRLGANAILGVSMAVARAAASVRCQPLYQSLATTGIRRLPVPMMNVINGGAHADNSLDFQEFMLVPHGAPSFAEAMRYGSEVFQALKAILKRSGHSTGVGDEGGFAPRLRDNEQACELIVQAIQSAGFAPGEQVAIALDPAASTFRHGNAYALSKSAAGTKASGDLIDLYARWSEVFPIVSIEDGLGEDDWDGFHALTARIGDRVQIVGDDIYVTNPDLIRRGIERRTTNAVLIKLNQIGTVTETIDAIELCRNANWQFIVSHRSGETEDPFIADFVVAMGGTQIKTGSLCRSERIAKYNRLLEIERDLSVNARFESPFTAERLADANVFT